jgi:hypothetical protein
MTSKWSESIRDDTCMKSDGHWLLRDHRNYGTGDDRSDLSTISYPHWYLMGQSIRFQHRLYSLRLRQKASFSRLPRLSSYRPEGMGEV